MTVPIEHPPIDPESFCRQTCEEEEYRRPTPPGSKKKYVRGGHCAYDFQAPPGRRTVYAVCDGEVRYVDHGAYLGTQLVIRSKATDFREGAFYAHLAERLVPDGAEVKAGDPVGIMGNTSSRPVGVHLHFETLRDWRVWRSVYDPGPQLRTLLEGMNMALSAEDKVWLETLVHNAVRATVQALGWGHNNPNSAFLPDNDDWADTLKKYNLRAVKQVVERPKGK